MLKCIYIFFFNFTKWIIIGPRLGALNYFDLIDYEEILIYFLKAQMK